MHIPVLLKETVDSLQIQKGDKVVDATLGGGGFSKRISDIFGKDIFIIGLDADKDAVKRTSGVLTGSDTEFVLETANFAEIKKTLDRLGFDEVDKVAFDLGLSSFQIDDSGRGFTFRKDEPLRMTFSKDFLSSKDVNAEEMVNNWSEDVLRTIISAYGEERFAGRISKGIVVARKIEPLKTTFDLVNVIEKSVPKGYRNRRTHPATKTFQALRMAVNDEITSLEEGLKGAFEKLSSGGRVSVISFHSLEDRLVKRFFMSLEKDLLAYRITKKPIRPSREEILNNRRSRSGKLRVLEKK